MTSEDNTRVRFPPPLIFGGLLALTKRVRRWL
jgi:hypothetical protein